MSTADDQVGKIGHITLDSWAGRHQIKVTVVGYTPKRLRVRLEQDALMPGGRRRKAGDIVVVPRDVVEVDEE